jgi:methionyl-tRNA formyltransferase
MTAGELHDILALTGGQLLVETLDALESGAIKPREQEHGQATKAPKITKSMCKIDFKEPVQRVHNHIRGLSPYPGAYCFHQNNLLKIFSSRIVEQDTVYSQPGRIIEARKDRLLVACKQGTLRILEVQLQGKKRLKVQDFFNGYALSLSDILS